MLAIRTYSWLQSKISNYLHTDVISFLSCRPCAGGGIRPLEVRHADSYTREGKWPSAISSCILHLCCGGSEELKVPVIMGTSKKALSFVAASAMHKVGRTRGQVPTPESETCTPSPAFHHPWGILGMTHDPSGLSKAPISVVKLPGYPACPCRTREA